MKYFSIIFLSLFTAACNLPELPELLPTPTMVPTVIPRPTLQRPATPTPEPTADVPDGWHRAVIRVYRIPDFGGVCDGETPPNKTPLFALHGADGSNLWVFHRCLWREHAWHPIGGDAAWWPTWRIEAGKCGAVEEWPIFDSHFVDAGEMVFEVMWNDAECRVTDQHGRSQHLDVGGRYDEVVPGAEATFCGVWPGSARAEVISWE